MQASFPSAVVINLYSALKPEDFSEGVGRVCGFGVSEYIELFSGGFNSGLFVGTR